MQETLIMFLIAWAHLQEIQDNRKVKKEEGRTTTFVFQIYSVLASTQLDESSSSAHAKEDALSSADTDVSILLSNIVHSSSMDARLEGFGLMQRITASHIV